MIYNLIGITIAIACLISMIIAINKLKKLSNIFSNGIVLIPLHKKNTGLKVVLLTTIPIILTLIILAIVTEFAIMFIGMAIGIMELTIIFIAMIRFKCAILDSGVVVPYRHINLTYLNGYQIVGENSIYFYGDNNGYDTLNSVTALMSYDTSDKEKLLYLLKEYNNY